ncbi:MAG TPA: sugar phosphate isomerase/epimerase [Planctomycetes bacterium]|nr:sugar phosphate isomerase/epimerase [Planctomycetota bacterium]
MRLGYNTNGMAHHELGDALRLLADIGYRSVAITIDVGALWPFAAETGRAVERVRRLLDRLELDSVIETGARYLLDPRVKHEPTLVSADSASRSRRVGFYKYAIDCAAELGSGCVSLWSGVLRDPVSWQEGMARLVAGLDEVLEHAALRGVPIGFEPEPGMFIDSMAGYETLLEHLPAGELRLTLDVGHLHCQGQGPIAGVIRRWASRLVNVHIEDMRSGVHEHLMFGEGEMDFPPIMAALAEAGYRGGIHVELSRHSHEAPTVARKAYAFLNPLMERYAQQDG